MPVRILVVVIFLIAFRLGAEPVVYETAQEFVATGDFDGDQRDDVVVVDRLTGVCRIAYQASAGSLTWVGSHAGGVENVTGVTAGHLLQTNRDALVLTAPAANRLCLLGLSNAVVSTPPVAVFPLGIGPEKVVALDVGGSSNTSLDDLLVTSDGGISVNRLELLRNGAGGFSSLWDGFAEGLVTYAWKVSWGVPPVNRAAVLSPSGSVNRLIIYDCSNGTPNVVLRDNSLRADAQILWARFGTAVYPTLVAWWTGQTSLSLIPVIDNPSGGLKLGTVKTATLPYAISQVVWIPVQDQLLVIFQRGTAAFFSVDEKLQLTRVGEYLSPSAGERLLTGLPISTNRVALFSAATNGGSCSSCQVLTWIDNGYSGSPGALLPTLRSHAGQANIMLFEHEPFLTNRPHRMASLRAGDWSLSVSLTGSSAQVTAQCQFDRGPTNGLGQTTNLNLGPVPVGAAHGLVSQYYPTISTFSHQPACGIEYGEVSLSPPAGHYPHAVTVTMSTRLSSPPHIYYRTDVGDSWRTYVQPVPLFRDTTLQYFSSFTGGALKSPLYSEQYTFAGAPDALDADHDGVPDYVEAAYGLDPATSGLDADGDGLSDLEELLWGSDPTNADSDADGYTDYEEFRAGADPRNASSHPTSHSSIPPVTPRYDYGAVFDAVATPHPYDGVVQSETLTVTGTMHYAYNLGGKRLAGGSAAMLGMAGVQDPAVRLSGLPTDVDNGFVVLSTEENFPIQTVFTNKNLGREMVAVVSAPEVALPHVTYTYGGGSLATEASNWVSAAKTAYSNAPATFVKLTLNCLDSLVAVLMEKKIGEILYARGVMPTSEISLLSYRVADGGRMVPSADQIRAIEYAAGTNLPGYRLKDCYRELNEFVDKSSSAQPLRDVVTEIYRISSASNAVSPQTMDLPIDVLRAFVRTGALCGIYSNSPISNRTLARAYGVARSLLDSVSPRPHSTLDLEVRDDSFVGDCTLAYAVGSGQAYSLFSSLGRPFTFPAVLEVLPGSVIRVSLYTDCPRPACTGISAEVESIFVMSVPGSSVMDGDGNLLPDDWERLVLGRTGNNRNADTDGDGYTDFQECLEGTDPTSSASHPGVPPVSLNLPAVKIAVPVGQPLDLSWSWPSRYQRDFQFVIESASDLRLGFTAQSQTPSTEGDNMRLRIPTPATGQGYYRLRISVR
jgi:hypothetical protein